MKLGFLTAPHLPHLTPDDRLVLPALAALGVTVEPVLWPHARWQQRPECLRADLNHLSGLLMRSCWTYHQMPEAFTLWLAQLQALQRSGLPVANLPSRFRQNMDKRYLLQVQASGHAIVPTQILTLKDLYARRERRDTLTHLLHCAPETPLVIKPVISASGENTFLWREAFPETLLFKGKAHASSLSAESPAWMVQPLVESIHDQGEYSLIFFQGQFSHGVRKLPAPTQFLVHEEHGGVTQAMVPPPALLAAARRLLQDEIWEAPLATQLYTRLDYVWHDAQWCLMEIESIEPSLYLAHDAQAPARWAEAISAYFLGAKV